MASAATCDNEIARIIIFDLRKSTAKDCRFSTAAQVVQYKFWLVGIPFTWLIHFDFFQELYNTVLLATSQNSSANFTHLSLLVVASKGFEFLLEILPVSNAKKNLKKVFARLKQLLCYFNKVKICEN